MSQGADDVEPVVVGVLPQRGVAKVGVVQELSSSLSPSYWFHFRVAPENRWVYRIKVSVCFESPVVVEGVKSDRQNTLLYIRTRKPFC